MASIGHCFGVELDILTPAEIERRHPMIDTRRVVGGLFIPGDGQTHPGNTTLALAEGARRARRDARRARVGHRRSTPAAAPSSACAPTAGDVGCEIVVNCAGIWARELGRMAGVNVPLYACEHMYVTTAPIDGVPPGLPVIRDTDGHVYVKDDAGKLLVGAFEPDGKPLPLEAAARRLRVRRAARGLGALRAAACARPRSWCRRSSTPRSRTS